MSNADDSVCEDFQNEEDCTWKERVIEEDIYGHAFRDCNMMTAYLNIQRKQLYKHMTHFTRVLDNCQGYGISRYEVPPHVFQIVREKKCQSVDEVRRLVKGVKGALGYSMCAYVLKQSRCSTQPFVYFNTHEYLLLRKLFKYVLAMYKEAPPTTTTKTDKKGKRKRGNFLNYTFVLIRLARHIGYDISHQLPSIKSRTTQVKYVPLAKWLDSVLLSCPITLEDVCPSDVIPLQRKK